MIELIVRHVALLAMAAVLSLLLRQRSAALRHALWSATLALLLLLPLLQRVPITLPQVFSRPVPAAEEREKEEPRSHFQGAVVDPGMAVSAAGSQPASQGLSWGAMALWAYMAIAAGLMARWGVGWALAARLARRATLLGTARGIPVLAADGVGPLTFGWPRGVIIVPHQRFALEKLVLRHEVAHVKRADFLWQGLGMLACALWWWSPFVWFAARQLRREAERACDDDVLNQGVSAPDYADCLLEVAAMKPISLPFAASLVQGELAARVTALLATGKDRRPAAPLAILGITALLLPVGLTLTRPVAAEVPQAPPVLPPASPAAPVALPRVIASAPVVKAPLAPPVFAPTKPVTSPRVAPVIAPAAPPVVAAPVLAPARLALPEPAAAVRSAAPAVAPDGSLDSGSAPVVTAPIDEAGQVAEAALAAGSLAGKRIVLDPGHGGTDHGAASGTGKGAPTLKDLPIVGQQFTDKKISEKDLSLAIALNAAERLRKEGAIVTLTRDSDTYLSLSKRAEFSAGQDLYLSIHIDSSDPARATNKQTTPQFRVALWFHGSQTPPPTQAKAFMDGIVTSFPAGNKKDAVTFGILSDSLVYASGFAVLRNAKCPAYLIDFGNMSFPGDVARLRTGEFQNTLAQSVVNGAKAIL